MLPPSSGGNNTTRRHKPEDLELNVTPILRVTQTELRLFPQKRPNVQKIGT